jgi:signal transduction histidine kinase
MVLHSDPRIEPLLESAAAPDISFHPLSLAEIKSEDQLLQVLSPQVQWADAVLVDLVSLQLLGKWVLAWLRANPTGVPVVVRMNPEQATLAELAPEWVFVFKNDPSERIRRTLANALGNHRAAKEVEYLRETLARRASPAPLPAGGSPGRESFAGVSRLLGGGESVHSLAEQIVTVLREMFAVGKVGVFLRERNVSLVKAGNAQTGGGRCMLAASFGIPRELTRILSLSLTSGVGGSASANAQIIRRDPLAGDALATFDPQLQKEFQVTGTQFAAPILDRETALGVVLFGGKVTGEPLRNDELELIFNLMNQFGIRLANLWLHQEVASQQAFMQDVLAHVQSGVVVIDAQHKIAAINHRAAALLNLGEKSALGADLSWLPAQVGDVLFQTAQSGQAAQHREITLAQTGRVLSVSTSRFAGRADAGMFTAGVIEDVTELKQQHAHARQIAQQEFILQLAARLSHELKNSLVSINTFAQLLPQQYERKEFRDEFFKIVAHEVTRVDLLVENLTFFAHPLILRYEEVDLTELLQTTLSRLVEECKRQHGSAVITSTTGQQTIPSVTGKPVVLNARFGHTAKKIECDPKRLSLAIHNIMYNAIQSMPDGGRLSLVTDDAKPNGHAEPRVQISVLDTGEGIALANLDHIFEPFFTTRNVGVGLGLTIAQKIVQKHGGHITVESKLSKGTSMMLTVPVKAAPATDDASPQREPSPALKSQSTSSKITEIGRRA